MPLSDKDLRADEVHARDDLGHGVLDLNPWVHLDEEPLISVGIEQELNGASVVIFD